MDKVMVLGAGSMGSGIAQVMVQAGYEVYLYDIKEEMVAKGLSRIGRALDKQLSKALINGSQRADMGARLHGTTDMAAGRDCILAIETVPENLELKCRIFRELDKTCREDAILASNTSSQSISAMAACTDRPDKVIGMHFFNPPPYAPMIEVVRGGMTSQETFDAMIGIVKALGKTPVTVNESPGFIVNRIMIPMINEAVCLLSEGVSDAADIDTAMKLGMSLQIGPLALGDFIGLDVVLAIMETLHREFGEDKYRPSPLLRSMVRSNRLGRKTGQGFYSY